jgi:hypothetical protein
MPLAARCYFTRSASYWAWSKTTEALFFALDTISVVLLIYWTMGADGKREDAISGLFAYRKSIDIAETTPSKRIRSAKTKAGRSRR